MEAFPETAYRILDLEQQIGEITANTKELKEALDVANDLQKVLNVIVKNLERASNWGDWKDLSLSRRLETKAKNRFVDKALSNVYIAQNLFEKFEKELKDIQDHQEIRGSYHFHDFGNFTEVYYNRLIADWIIQERIKNSKLNVQGVSDNVRLIAATLAYEIKNAEANIEDLKGQIDFIIKDTITRS